MENETTPNNLTGITDKIKADKSLARIVLKLEILIFESKVLMSTAIFFIFIDVYPQDLKCFFIYLPLIKWMQPIINSKCPNFYLN